MAYEIGVATSYLDLVEKLRTFLTTNVDLVAANEQWTQIEGPAGAMAPNELSVLMSTGASGNEEIYAIIQPYRSIANDWHGLRMWSFPFYDSNQDPLSQQSISPYAYMPLWDDTINYWFVANGRRFIVVAEVSTTWQSCYCGLIIPFAPPDEYPYPFLLAGMTPNLVRRYSDTDERIRFFASPGYKTAHIWNPDNQWSQVDNFSNSDTNSVPYKGDEGFVYPTRHWIPNNSTNQWNGWSDTYFGENVGKMLDGSHYLAQLQVVIVDPRLQAGVMEGAYFISGRDNAPGNVITDSNGDDFIITQNGSRNGYLDFLAVRLK